MNQIDLNIFCLVNLIKSLGGGGKSIRLFQKLFQKLKDKLYDKELATRTGFIVSRDAVGKSLIGKSIMMILTGGGLGYVAFGDFDGDRINNWNEWFKYHTDPFKPNPTLRALISRDKADDYDLFKSLDEDGELSSEEFELIHYFYRLPAELRYNQEYLNLLHQIVSDGKVTREELERFEDPDDDLLETLDEIKIYGTNPLVRDTDGDGLDDGEEIIYQGTNPLVRDTDGDGLDDGFEVKSNYASSLDPLKPNPVQAYAIKEKNFGPEVAAILAPLDDDGKLDDNDKKFVDLMYEHKDNLDEVINHSELLAYIASDGRITEKELYAEEVGLIYPESVEGFKEKECMLFVDFSNDNKLLDLFNKDPEVWPEFSNAYIKISVKYVIDPVVYGKIPRAWGIYEEKDGNYYQTHHTYEEVKDEIINARFQQIVETREFIQREKPELDVLGRAKELWPDEKVRKENYMILSFPSAIDSFSLKEKKDVDEVYGTWDYDRIEVMKENIREMDKEFDYVWEYVTNPDKPLGPGFFSGKTTDEAIIEYVGYWVGDPENPGTPRDPWPNSGIEALADCKLLLSEGDEISKTCLRIYALGINDVEGHEEGRVELTQLDLALLNMPSKRVSADYPGELPNWHGEIEFPLTPHDIELLYSRSDDELLLDPRTKMLNILWTRKQAFIDDGSAYLRTWDLDGRDYNICVTGHKLE